MGALLGMIPTTLAREIAREIHQIIQKHRVSERRMNLLLILDFSSNKETKMRWAEAV